MHYIDINKQYTAIIAEYLAKGYTINTGTMGGTQGDCAHIDLTDGTEIIRVMINVFHEYFGITFLNGLEIIVGRAESNDMPNRSDYESIVWNGELAIISRNRFYVIGNDHNHGAFYGEPAEAAAACKLRTQRSNACRKDTKIEFSTPKALEIAKRVIRQRTGVKRIQNADVRVFKYVAEHSEYIITYKEKLFVLNAEFVNRQRSLSRPFRVCSLSLRTIKNIPL